MGIASSLTEKRWRRGSPESVVGSCEPDTLGALDDNNDNVRVCLDPEKTVRDGLGCHVHVRRALVMFGMCVMLCQEKDALVCSG